MALIEYKHTLALYHKIREDLNKIGYILTIIIQAFLLFYYSYSIYIHKDSIVYIVLYSILLTISILLFTEETIYQYKRSKVKEDEFKETHKKKRNILKLCSLLTRFALLILSLIPIIQDTVSDFDKVITLALAILLVIQVCFIFVAYLINKYLTWLKKALELDYNDSTLLHPKKSIGNKFHNFAQSLDKKEDDENDEFMSMLNDQMEIDENQKKEKEEKRKQELKSQRKEDIAIIKRHIFKNKIEKKTEDENIQKYYSKCVDNVNQLLLDNKKYLSFLNRLDKKIKDNNLNEDLDYLYEYLTNLKSRMILGKDEKINIMVELYYYLNPLISNSITIEDNLKMHSLCLLKAPELTLSK